MSTTEEWKRGRRISAALNVVLEKGQAVYVVETKNVGPGGLCLRSEEAFAVGTQLHMVFGRLPDLPPLSVQGIVTWSELEKGVGVKFTSIRPDDQQALLRFLNSQSHIEAA